MLCPQRSLARQLNKDFEGAIADAIKTLELDPQMFDALIARASALNGNGDLSGAIADFDQVIALNPRRADSYAYRGLLKLRQGREKEAEQDFAQCLILDSAMTSYLDRHIQKIRQQSDHKTQ